MDRKQRSSKEEVMKNVFFSLASALVLLLAVSCGSSDSGNGLSGSLSDLSKLPTASGMIKATGSSSIQRSAMKNALGLPQGVFSAINLQSVQGTPPKVKDINSSNYDTIFYDGLIGTITGYSDGAWTALSNSTKQAYANQFWGNDTSTPGPGGNGACNMAMNTIESFMRMLSGTGTMCYMKGISTVSGGVTVTGSSAADAFKQTAADKYVKVNVVNMPSHDHRDRENMTVYFKVKGTNTVGGDVYEYDMWMCRAGEINNRENLSVNKTTGLLTASSSDGDGSNHGKNVVTAYLTTSGGNVVFDLSKDRTAQSSYTGTWGTFKGSVTIKSDNTILAKRYSSSDWGENKDISLSAFTGGSIDDLRFLQAAFKGVGTANNQSPWSYTGITEYRNTHYVSVASSDLSTSAAFTGVSVASDSFFNSDLTPPAVDTSGVSCSQTADVTVDMDFATTPVTELRESCDGQRDGFHYDMCMSADAQSAMTRLWSVH